MAMTMGQIIKRLRKERGFTQEQLAERLGVTYQAISKWENDAGMPDISQIVPLASIFGVSTDVLFGIDQTNETGEAFKIVSDADHVMEYGNLDSYLKAYDLLMAGLKKYPNNLIIMNNCVGLGTSLALPENGWIYAKERADEIASETIRQANYIISNSKDVNDVMRARQCLVFLYCAKQNFDLASSEARKFPIRTDFTVYSHMALVNRYMGNHAREATYFCSDIDYTLQAFENNTAYLGQAYYNSGKYAEAIDVYETFFAVMKAIFKEDCPPNYHDFDSGDCYLLLAKAYLAVGETDKAMDAVEKSITYYLNIPQKELAENPVYQIPIKTSLVKESELFHGIHRCVIKKILLEKLAEEDIQPLCREPRFAELVHRVHLMPE